MPRRQWVIFGLLAAITAASFYATTRGPGGVASHAGCFTHRDCAKGERCAVNPKEDGFATPGQCADPCTEDEQCPNGWRCLWLQESGQDYLRPRGSGERFRVCVDPKRF